MSAVQAPFGKVHIQRTYQDCTDWITAFRELHDSGRRMLLNIEHHNLLTTIPYDSFVLLRSAWPAWARDIVAIPAYGQRFGPEKDIADFETNWTLPASSFAEAEIRGGDPFAPGVALSIFPAQVEEINGVVAIIAQAITVTPDIQFSGRQGEVHPETGLTMKPTKAELQYEEKALMYYNPQETFRPPIRGWSILHDDIGLDVLLSPKANWRVGVLSVEENASPEK